MMLAWYAAVIFMLCTPVITKHLECSRFSETPFLIKNYYVKDKTCICISEGEFIKKLHTHAKDRVTEGVASYGKLIYCTLTYIYSLPSLFVSLSSCI